MERTWEVTMVVVVEGDSEDAAVEAARQMIANPSFEAMHVEEI